MFLEVVKAAFSSDLRRLELSALTLSRLLQAENKTLSKQLKDLLGAYAISGSYRAHDMKPLPTDHESQLEIATLHEPNIASSPMPILSESLKEYINFLIDERKNSDLLIKKDVLPTTRILLIGEPGTGKTMLAHYLAASFEKKLVVLDLSSAISSLLGRTGSNIKNALRYAQESSAVLLLDEFDAIAKKRDDSTDLGEMKRVVNVLLMELDNWSPSSMVVATSNHPELLDKAIWRRFDHVIEIGKPEYEERVALLEQEFGPFLKKNKYDSQDTDERLIKPMAQMLDKQSAADICRYTNNVKRRTVLNNGKFDKNCIIELEHLLRDKNARGDYCRLAREALGSRITLRELSEITGLTKSGVNYHLKHG